jgi:hypothetical protein
MCRARVFKKVLIVLSAGYFGGAPEGAKSYIFVTKYFNNLSGQHKSAVM